MISYSTSADHMEKIQVIHIGCPYAKLEIKLYRLLQLEEA